MILKNCFRAFCLFLLTFHFSAHADDWVRAESAQFIVYSDGNEKQAAKAAVELERLDALLRRLWQREKKPAGNKLEVYLLKDSRAVGKIAGSIGSVGIAGLYRGMAYGSFFLGNRRQSKYDEVLTGREVLFHEYAHHFFYQNFAIPAPAWFSEGFADYVSSAEVPESGGWAIGRPLAHYRNILFYGGQVPIKDLLTGKDREDHVHSFYAWSWVLTRYLYSGPQGRGAKISQYLAMLNQGGDVIKTAEHIFGDFEELERKLGEYALADRRFRRSSKPLEFDPQVETSRLSDEQSTLVELRLRRLTRSDVEERLQQLRSMTSASSASADAWYEFAQTSLSLADDPDKENYEETLRAVEAALNRALSVEPEHMRANVLLGRILLRRYTEAQNDEGSQIFVDRALTHFRTAAQAAPNHPWPLFNLANGLLYSSDDTEDRGELLARAFELAPESGELRSAYAAHLASQGAYNQAIGLLKIVANDPHGRGKSAARAIARMEALLEQEANGSTEGVQP